MKRIILFAVALCIMPNLFAQGNFTTRDLKMDDGTIKVRYFNNNPKVKAAPLKMYSWIEAGEIHQTQGDYHGRLLHGEFIKIDKEYQMLEKGHYKNGLKHGKWKQWEKSGILSEIKTWKNGELDGMHVLFKDGQTVSIKNYKKGKLHGKTFAVVDGELQMDKVYKKGEVKKKTPKKFNITKLKEKIEDEGDDVESEEQEKKSDKKDKKENKEKDEEQN